MKLNTSLYKEDYLKIIKIKTKRSVSAILIYLREIITFRIKSKLLVFN